MEIKDDCLLSVLYDFIVKRHNAYEQWQASLSGKFAAKIVLLTFIHHGLKEAETKFLGQGTSQFFV